ncbi:MAG TPA: MFS transporter [Acidimicrobiales bacterium]|nr:MFS transporter [Acidimicrobiales bacterium]
MNARLASATRETFASFRVRNFRLFFVGQGISQVGNWLTLIAQSLLVLDLTGDGVAVGFLVACQFLPVLLLGPWAGLVADRSDKRRLLLTVQVVAMGQSFALGALAFMDEPPLAALYAVASIGGLCMAFDNPARRSFVVEMVPDDLVHNAVSLNSAMMTSSRVIGPALGGLLITTVGYGWAFLADGSSYVAVLFSLWLMRTEELHPAPATPRGRGQVREGFRYVRRTPVLFVPLVMMAAVGTLAFNFQVTFPLVVTRTFDQSKVMFTILFSVISAGSLVGALWTARRRSIGVDDVVRASAGFGVALLALALAPNIWWAFPIGVLVGITSIGFLTASTAIVQTEAAPEMRGRVLALQAMVFLGSTPIGGPIVGAVAEHVGPRWSVAVGAASCIGAAVYGTLACRGVDRDATAQEELAVPVPEPT